MLFTLISPVVFTFLMWLLLVLGFSREREPIREYMYIISYRN